MHDEKNWSEWRGAMDERVNWLMNNQKTLTRLTLLSVACSFVAAGDKILPVAKAFAEGLIK